MKPATITELKKELKYRSQEQLVDYCLAMARFKLESKELLTYLVKKSVRKILRQVKRFIRYSKKKETEAELLIYFCKELGEMKPSYKRNTVLTNTYNKQLELAQKAIAKIHEDLQYDFNLMIEELES